MQVVPRNVDTNEQVQNLEESPQAVIVPEVQLTSADVSNKTQVQRERSQQQIIFSSESLGPPMNPSKPWMRSCFKLDRNKETSVHTSEIDTEHFGSRLDSKINPPLIDANSAKSLKVKIPSPDVQISQRDIVREEGEDANPMTKFKSFLNRQSPNKRVYTKYASVRHQSPALRGSP